MSVLVQFLLFGLFTAYRTTRLEVARCDAPTLRFTRRTLLANLVLFCAVVPAVCAMLTMSGMAALSISSDQVASYWAFPFGVLWFALGEILLRRLRVRDIQTHPHGRLRLAQALLQRAALGLAGRALLAAGGLTVLFASFGPRCGSRETAYFDMMRKDLQRVSAAQSERLSRGLPPASTIEELEVQPSPGVMVSVAMTPGGWSAVAKHHAFGPAEFCATDQDGQSRARGWLGEEVDVDCTR